MTATKRKIPLVEWARLDTVLLDMDGTLLDRHFDDYFWRCYLPENYALKHDLEVEEALRRLEVMFARREGTLAWADIDYWSEVLDLDIPELKRRVDTLIGIHPHVIEFLQFCRNNAKQVCLVTNAHRKTLEIKMTKASRILQYCDQVVCAEELGRAKEEAEFWPRLERRLGYDKERTMLADDTERVLEAAAGYGLRQLVHVARPSSRLPVSFSRKYPSISYFKELLP